MKILSIDVGIKNLAFCLFSKSVEQEEHHFHIEKWDSINLAQQNDMKCLEIEKNQAVIFLDFDFETLCNIFSFLL